MNINERIDNIKEVINNTNLADENGVVIDSLHNDILEDIAKSIIKSEAVVTTKNKESKEEYKKYLKSKTDFENLLNNKFGSFYFNFFNSIPKSLDKQYKFRFIYLCTYLKYNDNRLMYKQSNGLYKLYKENDLSDILHLGNTEYYKTKKILIENNLMSIDDDKNICVNNRISLVGEISKYNKRDYTRIFKDTVQKLYNSSKPREHKLLGMFIDLLPLINFKFNIICSNPDCELMEDVKPLTISDISQYFNIYTGKNISSLKRKLLSIKLDNKDMLMYVEKSDINGFLVNPSLYYKGNNIEDLNYLIELFKL